MKGLPLIALAIMLTMGAGQAAPAAAANATLLYTFDQGITPFTAAAIPSTVATRDMLGWVEDPGERPGPSGHALLTNNVAATAVYMAAPQKGSGIMLRVTVQARDAGGCKRCAVIIAVGSGKPDSLGAFQKVGLATPRWATYTMQVPLTGPNPVVAVGLFNLDGVHYTQQLAVDNLSVQFLDD